jgi:hypothetical protein
MNKSPLLGFNRPKIRQRKSHRRTRRAWFEQLEDRRMLAILMVDADASSGGGGQAWESAYNDLQDALTQAAALNADGDTDNDIDAIWIAEGTYKPSALLEAGDARSASFSLLDGVSLYGGFSGIETSLDDRDWLAFETTFSGDVGIIGDASDNAYTVVYCGDSVSTTIDGIGITGGSGDASTESTRPETSSGGGIFNDAGTLTVRNSRLWGNSAASGGGIANHTGTLSVANSTLSDNIASSTGGGIANTGTLTIANSTLSGNTASSAGGGIAGYAGTLTLINSTLWGNSADSGGGVYSFDTLTVTNSILAGNAATAGGGIHSSGELTITNSTLTANSANRGGGIYRGRFSSTGTLSNTIVAGNVASSGPDTYYLPGMLSGSNNLIGDGSGVSPWVDGINGNQVGTASSPIDPLLSDWTQFDDGSWGYYLLPGSPAVDSGDNSLAVDSAGQPLTEDRLGSVRIQNGTVDLGAVEGVRAGNSAQTYTVTSLEATVANDGVLTFLEAFQAAARNQPVGDAVAGSFSERDTIQFAVGVSGTIPVDDGELSISGDLSIEGPGTELLTFDAQGRNRVFLIRPNVSLNLRGLTVTGGSADEGGGVYNHSGMLTVARATLSGNSASGSGGGIYNADNGTVTVTNSVLSGNSAGGSGGGICNARYGRVTVTNSALSGNSVGGSGGGIANAYQGALTVTNSTLSANTAESSGGGLVGSGTTTTVLNNTIVAGNQAADGPDLYGTLSGSHNLIGDGAEQSSLVDGVDGNRVGDSSSPIDPLLSHWTQLNNGQWGYYLLPGSPAIDAGRNELAITPAGQPLDEDMVGHPRILDGTVDMGAVEGEMAGDPARIYTVTSLEKSIADDGILTLLEAFEASNRNRPVGDAAAGSFRERDIIRFAAGLSGTVLLDHGQLVISGDLNIEGPGAELLVFDGDGRNRIFAVGRNVAVALSGVTITGGAADKGGAIYSEGALAVASVTLSGNSAKSGGGIYSRDGTLTVTDSTFSGNTAVSNGGAIHSEVGTMTITDSTLSENTAGDNGGGTYSGSDGVVTVTDSTLWGNTANGDGGGIYSGSDGIVTVTDSTLWGNDANGNGGGIYRGRYGLLVVSNSTLSGNSAASGGGIYQDYGTLSVANAILSGNSASSSGGGIYQNYGALWVVNATLSGNSASSSGGGIYGSSVLALRMHNTIVAGNGAPAGPDVYSGTDTGFGSNNLIADGSGQSIWVDGEWGNQVGTSTSPIDPLLSDWTHFDDGRWGYYPLPGSPVIDSGDNDRALDASGQPLIEDILGNPRILDGTVDIGAIEGATAGSSAQNYNVASLENTIADDGVLTFMEAFEAASRNQPVGDAAAGSFSEPDVIQFADGLSGTVLVDRGELVIAGDLRIEGPGAELLAFDARGENRVFFIQPNAALNLGGVTIRGGSADAGGGIYNSYGALTVTSAAFSGNAADAGGGVYNSGTLAAVNTTFVGNSASHEGGGIYNWGALTITNSTLAGNVAPGGGGIANSGALTVNNSIIGLNSEHNILGPFDGANSLINMAPGFVRAPSAGADGDWGTDDDDLGDLSLGDRSPAINAGDNSLAVDPSGNPLTGDSAGEARMADGTVDAGAYEYQGPPASGREPPSLIVSAPNDRVDLYDGVVTLREAIYYAQSGVGDGTITFSGNLDGGTITLGGLALPIIHSVAIDASALSSLTVDADARSRVFTIAADATLSGLTIRGGSAGEGAGIYHSSGTLAIVNSTLSGNSAGVGGGIYSRLGALTVTNTMLSGNSADDAGGGIYSSGVLTVTSSTFSDNSAFGDGGGIHNDGGTLTVTDSTLSNNSARGGGGIHNDGGTLAVTGSTLLNNLASDDGGGIYISNGTLTVADSTLSGNSAGQRGGGVFHYGGSLTAVRSVLSGNSAGWLGGGIYTTGYYGTATLTDSTLWDNAAGSGGGIYSDGRTLTFTNATLWGNSALGDGGGIYSDGVTLTSTNSTVSDNWAGSAGGGLYIDGMYSKTTLNNTIVAGNGASSKPDVNLASGTLTGAHNLIGDGAWQSALVDNVDGNLVGTSSSPLDPKLGDWSRRDGGQWGYHLLPGSPALDAGDNELALDSAGQPLVEDALGNARIQNGTVDVGAVEGATTGHPAQIYTVTSLESTIASDGVLTFMEAFEAANHNQSAGDGAAGSFSETDIIRFAEGLSGTIVLDDGELVISGDLTIQGPGAESLVFDAQEQHRVFLIWRSASVSLGGMTVTGGLADEGGGICNTGTLALRDSILSDNSATSGGGIHNSGNLTLTDVTLSDNSADSGGGVYSSGAVTLTNATLSNNSAGQAGGGVNSSGGVLTITNSTLSENSAAFGGAIYSFGSSSTATLRNAIVAGNEASSGPDIYDGSGLLSGSHNLIGDGSGQSALVDGVDGNQIGTAVSPLDPRLRDWTRFENGLWGYGLRPDSPAINAGRNDLLPDDAYDLDDDKNTSEPIPLDASGRLRVFFGVVDIGAWEYSSDELVVAGHWPRDAFFSGQTEVSLFFSRELVAMTTEDLVLVGPDGVVPIAKVTRTWHGEGSSEYAIRFEPLVTAGDYQLTVMPTVRDQEGGLLNQDGDGTPGESEDDRCVASWTLAGPKIDSSWPNGTVPFLPSFSHFDIAFSAAMERDSFSLDDIQELASPDGAITPTGYRWLDDRTLRVMYEPLGSTSSVSITVGSEVYDRWGNGLDQNQNGIGGELEDTWTGTVAGSGSGTVDRDLVIPSSAGVVVIDATVTIAAGATLAIEPGVTLKFASGAALVVDGDLIVRGTVDQPVVFTSLADDDAGGDTNGDGNATIPARGSWPGLRIADSSPRLTLDHLVLRYAEFGIETVYDRAEIELRNSIITDNTNGLRWWAQNYTSASIENTLLTRNGVAINAHGNAQTSARNLTIAENDIGIELGDCSLTLDNSIVAFNGIGLRHVGPEPFLDIRYSDLFHPDGVNISWEGQGTEPSPFGSHGNFSADPLFVDRANGNFELSPGSRAVDAGRGTHAPSTDLSGRPRYDDAGMPNLGIHFPAYVDMGAFERQDDTVAPDLAVDLVSAPVPGAANTGGNFGFQYQVTNIGTDAFSQSWQDRVYLSDDPYLGNDQLLATFDHTTPLASGASYSQPVDVTVPDVVGAMYVLVHVNAAPAIREASEMNNVGVALGTLAVGIPQLEIGTPSNGTIGFGQWQYFRLQTQPGPTVVLSLADSDVPLDIYVRQDRPPTSTEFDVHAFSSQGEKVVEARILDPQEGIYYVAVVSQQLGSASPVNYTLSAEPAILDIREVGPDTVTAGSRVTVEVIGDQFDSRARVLLHGPAGTQVEGQVRYQDASTLFATFDLQAASAGPGLYDLEVINGDQQTVAAVGALTVAEQAPGGFHVSINVPPMSRPGRTITVTLHYGNDGLEDITAPALGLYSSGQVTEWLLPGSDEWITGPDLFLRHLSQAGPVDVLRPGQTESIEVRARLTFVPDPYWISVSAFDLTSDNPSYDPALLDQIEGDVRPAPDRIFSLRGEPDVYLDDALGLPAGVLSGLVLDDVTGEPVSNVTVTADNVGRARHAVATTDNLGRFILYGLPPGECRIWVENHLVVGAQVVDFPEDEGVFVADIRVNAASQIVGTVSRAAGAARVANAVITLTNPANDYVQSVLTDDAGDYVLDGVPSGVYSISCSADGLATQTVVDLEIDAKPKVVVSFSLGQESTISGEVAFEPPSSATDDVWVIARRSDTSGLDSWFFGTTEKNSFTVDGLSPGTYEVVIGASGFESLHVQGAIVPETATLDLGILSLAPEPRAQLRGQVVSANVEYSVSDAIVGLYQGGELVTFTFSETDGFFELEGLTAGVYSLRVDNVPQGLADETVVRLGGDEIIDSIQLHIIAGGTVGGRVVDDTTGDPVAGVPVNVFDANGRIRTGFTDADGNYRFLGLEAGDYFVTMPLAMNRTVESLSVIDTDGTAVAASDIRVDSIASIRGRLTDTDGAPIPRGSIEVFQGGFLVAAATTNEEGEYGLAFVGSGEFDLVASAEGKTFDELTGIVLQANDEIGQDFQAGNSSLAISVFDDGAPSESATVFVYRDTPRGLDLFAIRDTDANGAADLDGLVAGTYVVHAQGAGNRGARQQIVLGADASHSLRADLQRLAALTGIVTDEAGRPVSGATLTLESAVDPELEWNTLTDSDGMYALSYVIPGEYEFVVLADHYTVHVQTGLSVLDDQQLDPVLTDSPAELILTVVDTARRPIPLAEVMLRDSDGKIVGRAVTDQTGGARITTGAGSGMVVRVNAEGFAATQMSDVVVAEGQVTALGQVAIVATAYEVRQQEIPAIPPAPAHQLKPSENPAANAGLQQSTPPPYPAAIQTPNWLSSAFFHYGGSPNHVLLSSIPPLPAGCSQCDDDRRRARSKAGLQDAWLSAVKDLEKDFDQLIWPTIRAIERDTAIAVGAVADAAVAINAAIRAARLAGIGEVGAERAAVDQIVGIGGAVPSIHLAIENVAWSDGPKQLIARITFANDIWANMVDATNKAVEVFHLVAKEYRESNQWGKYTAALKVYGLLNTALKTMNGEEVLFVETDEAVDAIIVARERFENAVFYYEQHVGRARTAFGTYEYCLFRCGNGGGGPRPFSLTPEDKFGPGGYDAPGTSQGSEVRFIQAGKSLDYRIDFWNKPDAVVPTQDAIIIDRLDPSVFDVSTLEITRVGFLNWDLKVSSGQVVDVRIDTRPDMNIAVEIKAGLGMQVPGFANNGDIDENTIVFWFHVIDPETGEWPEDPMEGFLPPYNPETGFEIGWVEYTVDPVEGLASGTQLTNVAYVEFDFAGDIYDHPAPKVDPDVEPADPAPWINTIDAAGPTSQVEPLPFSTPNEVVTVRWSGQDDTGGSGVASYDIYVAMDDAPFQLWLDDTTETEALFTGSPGHKYAFYSVATDNVGHREDVPLIAQAQTSVIDDSWHNSANPFDVDGVDGVTPGDVLTVINYINAHPGDVSLPALPSLPPPYLDVDGDNQVTAADVLAIVNFLNNRSAEGETVAARPRSQLAAFPSPGQLPATSAVNPRETDKAATLPFEDAIETLSYAACTPVAAMNLTPASRSRATKVDQAISELGDEFLDQLLVFDQLESDLLVR